MCGGEQLIVGHSGKHISYVGHDFSRFACDWNPLSIAIQDLKSSVGFTTEKRDQIDIFMWGCSHGSGICVG